MRCLLRCGCQAAGRRRGKSYIDNLAGFVTTAGADFHFFRSARA